MKCLAKRWIRSLLHDMIKQIGFGAVLWRDRCREHRRYVAGRITRTKLAPRTKKHVLALRAKIMPEGNLGFVPASQSLTGRRLGLPFDHVDEFTVRQVSLCRDEQTPHFEKPVARSLVRCNDARGPWIGYGSRAQPNNVRSLGPLRHRIAPGTPRPGRVAAAWLTNRYGSEPGPSSPDGAPHNRQRPAHRRAVVPWGATLRPADPGKRTHGPENRFVAGLPVVEWLWNFRMSGASLRRPVAPRIGPAEAMGQGPAATPNGPRDPPTTGNLLAETLADTGKTVTTGSALSH